MNKKVWYSFVLAILILLSLPHNGLASGWITPEHSVSTTKDWKITLSHPVDRNSITPANIYVINSSGEKIETNVERQPGHPKVIWVYAPKEGYEKDQYYTLHISDQLLAADGELLQNPIEMKFHIEFENIQNIVLGTWKTSYAGFDMIATFTKDYQSFVEVPSLELVSDGKYSIDGRIMTMQLLGTTAKGSVTQASTNTFTITSASGNKMTFTR